MLIHVTAVDTADFARACAHEHVLGARAQTALRTYGLGNANELFYLCRKGREASAALYLSHGVLTISSDERADPVPISELIAQENIRVIETNQHQCKMLQELLGGKLESSYYLAYRGARDSAEYPDIRRGDTAEDAALLRRSREWAQTHLNFEDWLTDLTLRLTRGQAELYHLEQDGVAAAVGAVLYEDAESGVIGAIAAETDELAVQMCRFLIQRVLEKGKTPRLLAGSDAEVEHFCELGFATCGRWGRLTLPEKN